LTAAQRLAGVRYQMGGDSPTTGFDCSGYVRYVFGLFRIPLPRTVSEQFRSGQAVKGTTIKPGDLLFFKTIGSQVSHVALALGPDEFIHAPAGSGVVRTEKLSSPYWRTRFVGSRRIL
jgi:murein DD-endopeptidase